jgi:hypothetical protein
MPQTISLQTSSLIAPSALTLNLVLTIAILAPVRWTESGLSCDAPCTTGPQALRHSSAPASSGTGWRC